MKRIFDVMKDEVSSKFEAQELDLLSVSDGTDTDKETGEITKYTRFEVEVPRGFSGYSRCRFTVKVPNMSSKVTNDDLAKKEYSIFFNGLLVSYISSRGDVYFRAEDFNIEETQ